MEDDYYELSYNEYLRLSGSVMENDYRWIEDEVYEYKYQSALDGISLYTININTPEGASEYIDPKAFAIYYIDQNLIKQPLFPDDPYDLIDDSMPPQLQYKDGQYKLEIRWNPSEISRYLYYDTYLLITYRIKGGIPITPLSYRTQDEYGNYREDNLAEIPFAKFDMKTLSWKTHDTFTELFSIDRVLAVDERDAETIISSSGRFYINGPQIEGIFDRMCTLGIDTIYIKRNGSDDLLPISEDYYQYGVSDYITVDLNLNAVTLNSGDLIITEYYYCNPITLSHPLELESIEYVRVYNNSGYWDIPSDAYYISDDYNDNTGEYYLVFRDLIGTLNSKGYDIFDTFEIRYNSTYTTRADLSDTLILMMQDRNSEYIPIDIIDIDRMGFFEYEKLFSADYLALPIDTLVNMRLCYLPESIYDINSGSQYKIPYNFQYAYKESNAWTKDFRIRTLPEPTQLMMVNYESMPLVVSQYHHPERKYILNSDPFVTLEKGEEYTQIQIDAVRESYEFSFKLTSDDVPIEGAVVFLQIGYTPNAETGYENTHAINSENNAHPYYEALGVNLLTREGPGINHNMFARPLTYSTWKGTRYGPYIYQFSLTDESGIASFTVNFDNDYLTDYTNIFGNLPVDSIDDIPMYIRVWSAPVLWNDMLLPNNNELICSKNGDIFTAQDIPQDYDMFNMKQIDSTYIEGLIRLHPKDTVLGMKDRLSVDLPDPNDPNTEYESLKIHLFATQAKPITSIISGSLESLTKVHEIGELEPLPESILNDGHVVKAHIQIFAPDGHEIPDFNIIRQIYPSGDGGYIEFTPNEFKSIVQYGPGLYSIRIRLQPSFYYKESPELAIPLEVKPPYWMRFGEKNIQIDLFDPFINAWGQSFTGKTKDVYESAYPHLQGTFFIKPRYDMNLEDNPNTTKDERDISYDDIIDMNIECIVLENDAPPINLKDGIPFDLIQTRFPLRQGLELKPINREGFYHVDIGLGPEDAFLNGLNVIINISFEISDDTYRSLGERTIDIYVLELKLVQNPSSRDSQVLWSLGDNGLTPFHPWMDSAEINSGQVKKGGVISTRYGSESSGVRMRYTFHEDQLEYSIDPAHICRNFMGLVSILGVAAS
ncbi:MAG: hypothetical protein ACTSQ8_24120 [Candidatus Helarchaeota archaeon]